MLSYVRQYPNAFMLLIKFLELTSVTSVDVLNARNWKTLTVFG